MNPALLIALITQVGIPELQAWLASRHAAGQTVTDADVLAKLEMDADAGIKIADDWLTAHPLPPAA